MMSSLLLLRSSGSLALGLKKSIKPNITISKLSIQKLNIPNQTHKPLTPSTLLLHRSHGTHSRRTNTLVQSPEPFEFQFYEAPEELPDGTEDTPHRKGINLLLECIKEKNFILGRQVIKALQQNESIWLMSDALREVVLDFAYVSEDHKLAYQVLKKIVNMDYWSYKRRGTIYKICYLLVQSNDEFLRAAAFSLYDHENVKPLHMFSLSCFMMLQYAKRKELFYAKSMMHMILRDGYPPKQFPFGEIMLILSNYPERFYTVKSLYHRALVEYKNNPPPEIYNAIMHSSIVGGEAPFFFVTLRKILGIHYRQTRILRESHSQNKSNDPSLNWSDPMSSSSEMNYDPDTQNFESTHPEEFDPTIEAENSQKDEKGIEIIKTDEYDYTDARILRRAFSPQLLTRILWNNGQSVIVDPYPHYKRRLVEFRKKILHELSVEINELARIEDSEKTPEDHKKLVVAISEIFMLSAGTDFLKHRTIYWLLSLVTNFQLEDLVKIYPQTIRLYINLGMTQAAEDLIDSMTDPIYREELKKVFPYLSDYYGKTVQLEKALKLKNKVEEVFEISPKDLYNGILLACWNEETKVLNEHYWTIVGQLPPEWLEDYCPMMAYILTKAGKYDNLVQLIQSAPSTSMREKMIINTLRVLYKNKGPAQKKFTNLLLEKVLNRGQKVDPTLGNLFLKCCDSLDEAMKTYNSLSDLGKFGTMSTYSILLQFCEDAGDTAAAEKIRAEMDRRKEIHRNFDHYKKRTDYLYDQRSE